MIGVNFRTASVAIREKMAIAPMDVPRILLCLKRFFPDCELVLLSTCNRIELYLAGKTFSDYKHLLPYFFIRPPEICDINEVKKYLYIKENLDAVEHLFGVTSSIDSMVVGEREILGQVKSAYLSALNSGTTGKRLNQLFQSAFRVAKKIQTDTELCRGRISISSIAVEFAVKLFSDLSSKTVLVIGSGDTSELTLRALVNNGVKKIFVLNRSPQRAKVLAEQIGGIPVPFDLLEDFLRDADIVISSTAAPCTVIRHASVEGVMRIRPERPLFLIDIAVPRDIDKTVETIEGVHLYNIDDLEFLARQTQTKRRLAIDPSLKIIQSAVQRFTESDKSMSPTISDYSRMELSARVNT
jgi:glutamyl-tRNA reductase